MKNKRFKDNLENRFTISEPDMDDPILIVCPRCSSKAVVTSLNTDNRVRALCDQCGYTKENQSNNRCFYWHNNDPTDGYFGFSLWLKTDCAGNSLWAFNRKHLTFLESYVSAKLRAHNKDEFGWKNSSLASRLPKWIKSCKNREALLTAITKLKTKI